MSHSRSCILIVDPDEDSATSLAIHLQERGYFVYRRSLGIDALEFIAAQTPDLVVSVPDLPDYPGIDFLEAVGRISAATPVILSDRSNDPGSVRRRIADVSMLDLLDEVNYLLDSVSV